MALILATYEERLKSVWSLSFFSAGSLTTVDFDLTWLVSAVWEEVSDLVPDLLERTFQPLDIISSSEASGLEGEEELRAWSPSSGRGDSREGVNLRQNWGLSAMSPPTWGVDLEARPGCLRLTGSEFAACGETPALRVERGGGGVWWFPTRGPPSVPSPTFSLCVGVPLDFGLSVGEEEVGENTSES